MKEYKVFKKEDKWILDSNGKQKEFTLYEIAVNKAIYETKNNIPAKISIDNLDGKGKLVDGTYKSDNISELDKINVKDKKVSNSNNENLEYKAKRRKLDQVLSDTKKLIQFNAKAKVASIKLKNKERVKNINSKDIFYWSKLQATLLGVPLIILPLLSMPVNRGSNVFAYNNNDLVDSNIETDTFYAKEQGNFPDATYWFSSTIAYGNDVNQGEIKYENSDNIIYYLNYIFDTDFYAPTTQVVTTFDDGQDATDSSSVKNSFLVAPSNSSIDDSKVYNSDLTAKNVVVNKTIDIAENNNSGLSIDIYEPSDSAESNKQDLTQDEINNVLNEVNDWEWNATYTINDFNYYIVDNESDIIAITDIDYKVDYKLIDPDGNDIDIAGETTSQNWITNTALDMVISEAYNDKNGSSITNNEANKYQSLKTNISISESKPVNQIEYAESYTISKNEVLNVDVYNSYNSTTPILEPMSYVRPQSDNYSMTISSIIFGAIFWIYIIGLWSSKKEKQNKFIYLFAISSGIVATALSGTIAAIVIGSIAILGTLPIAVKSFIK